MEPTDFTMMPRTGRAIDFVYRLSFFERPMVDLAGKHFTIQDSSSIGTHRADASSLEISDATLSYALMTVGAQEAEKGDDESAFGRTGIDMGEDGYRKCVSRVLHSIVASFLTLFFFQPLFG
jgi:hypothetical protein